MTPARAAVRQRHGLVVAMAVVAIAEAGLVVLLAMRWLHTGADMFEQGVLVLPLLGVILYFRAALLVVTATLYLLFAAAALTGRPWARPIGLAAIALDGVLVLTLLAMPMSATLRAVLPLLLLCALLSAAGRRALAR
jgi:hypothetical protein